VRRYVSADEDSARWAHVRHRQGDIVISTRSKSGTTWMQMICAVLIFGDPTLPEPLGQLSPWIDHTIEPIDVVVARLEAQQHRRVLKTHTPLDGIPLDPRVHYIVVARHPLDMAVSLFHQGNNVDRARLAELTGVPATSPVRDQPSVHDWLWAWIQEETTAQEQMDSLVGVIHHIQDAWRRQQDPRVDVMLVHYADLSVDLEGSMRAIARRLNLDPPEQVWPALTEAASFGSMRHRADQLAPDHLGVLKDHHLFFRSGRSGEGTALLTPTELAAYQERVESLAPHEVLTWLHR
jgi:aryl sulfotransferase